MRSQPPRHMPEALQAAFTLDGQIPVADYYVDDTRGGEGTHYRFSERDVNAMVASISTARSRALRRAERQSDKSTWIYEALKAHPIDGLDVVIFGSMEPYYEAICVAHGAKSVTTVEYNNLTYDHPKMRTVRVGEELPLGSFDIALSISSFDHDGLGRYGDPVRPDGDILAMQRVRELLKPNGLFIFSVPIGPDIIVWNLHRRYGPTRLPLMLEGFDIVSRFGWDDALLTRPRSYTRSYEPVHVLRPSARPSSTADGDSGSVKAREEL